MDFIPSTVKYSNSYNVRTINTHNIQLPRIRVNPEYQKGFNHTLVDFGNSEITILISIAVSLRKGFYEKRVIQHGSFA